MRAPLALFALWLTALPAVGADPLYSGPLSSGPHSSEPSSSERPTSEHSSSAASSRTPLTDFPDVVEAARTVEVVLIGEAHDNPTHHAVQRDLVARLAPAALVFEMFPQELDEALNAARASGASRADLYRLLDWANSGWPAFSYYAEILEAAPDALVMGAEKDRAEVRQAVADGAAAVFGPRAADFGLDRPLPQAQQAAREALQAEAHCNALPDAMLPGMVEAQRFRDGALAAAVLAALEEAGPPVAVITGNGHARRDWGVPALLAQAAPGLSVLSIGQFETMPQDPPFDHVFLSAPRDRGDPCAAFR